MWVLMKTKLIESQDYSSAKKTRSLASKYINFCKYLSSKFPWITNEDVKVTEKLKKSLDFLAWDLKPYEVVAASRAVMIISAIIVLLVNIISLFYIPPSIVVITFSAIVPFVIANAITEFPKTEYNFEIIDSLSYAPTILTQLVVYLKQNPNLERAMHFVSKYSEGKIADEIKNVLWKCLMGYKLNLKEELGRMAQKWGEYLAELKRSLYLIAASVSEKNEIKRNQTLDRAIKISLEGIIHKIEDYTNQLYLPTLFLFSFGTILPLVIISLLPILSFLGGEFSSPLQIFLALAISLIAIYFYSNKVLAKRPPSFSTIKLPNNLPEYPPPAYMKFKIGKKEIEVKAVPYTILTFLVISFPGLMFLLGGIPSLSFAQDYFSSMLKGFNTLTIVWGFGIAITVYAYGTSWYKKNMRSKIKELETEIVDGTYQLASRIDEGRSPEDTILYISKNMPKTEFGEIMNKTYKVLRSRHTTIEDSFFNKEYGTLKDVHSKNFKLIIRLFVNSLKKSISHSAQTLFTISNHYDQLNKTEEKLKTILKNSLSMMRTTASIFAPMITGLIIALQQLIQDGLRNAKSGLGDMGYQYINLSFISPPSFSVEILQLIAGIYMILLAYLLIRYVSLLEYGKDEVMLKYEVSKNLPIAIFIFTLTLILSRFVLKV